MPEILKTLSELDVKVFSISKKDNGIIEIALDIVSYTQKNCTINQFQVKMADGNWYPCAYNAADLINIELTNEVTRVILKWNALYDLGCMRMRDSVSIRFSFIDRIPEEGVGRDTGFYYLNIKDVNFTHLLIEKLPPYFDPYLRFEFKMRAINHKCHSHYQIEIDTSPVFNSPDYRIFDSMNNPEYWLADNEAFPVYGVKNNIAHKIVFFNPALTSSSIGKYYYRIVPIVFTNWVVIENPVDGLVLIGNNIDVNGYVINFENE